MARRILNRKELRANYEAAELRKKDGEETDELEDEDEDDDEEEEGDATAVAEAEEEGEGEDADEDEEAPKKRKAVQPAKPKTRSRAAKITRLKAVWGVFNNTNQRVAVFDYPKRREAEEMAAKLTTDKKSTHFIQMVKEPLEENKDV